VSKLTTVYVLIVSLSHSVLCVIFQGFSNVAKGLLQLGLLSDEQIPSLHPNGPEKTWVRKHFLVKDIYVSTFRFLIAILVNHKFKGT